MALSRRGFSLIEVVIAIGMMGGVLVLLVAVSRALPLTRIAAHQDIALRIAENKIESLRALGYGNLPSSGSFSDALLSSLPLSSATLAVTSVGSSSQEAVVTVNWHEASSSTALSVSLSTLLAQGGLP